MAWIAGFLPGVLTLCFLTSLPGATSLHPVAIIALGLLLSCAWLCWRKNIICLAISGLVTGVVYSHTVAQRQLDSRVTELHNGKDYLVSGQIVSPIRNVSFERHNDSDKHSDKSAAASQLAQQFLLRVDAITPSSTDIDKNLLAAQSPRRQLEMRMLKVSNYHPLPMQAGQRWRLKLRLKQGRGTANPAGFDYSRYLLAAGIDGLAHIRHDYPPTLIEQPHSTYDLRNERIAALAKPLAAFRQGDLLMALLLGERAQLDDNTQSLLLRTGTAHLLAISGLHIGIAAMFGALLIRLALRCCPVLLLRVPQQVLQIFAAVPLAVFYAVLAGLSVPTQRALIMLLCFSVSLLLQRNLASHITLLVTAFTIVVINPLTVLSSGFWFSFGCVATLLIAAKLIASSNSRDQSSVHRPARNYLSAFWRAQWALFLAMPLILANFHGQGSLIAPLANLFAIPVVSVAVVPPGILAMICSYFSNELALLLFSIADSSLVYLLQCLQWLDQSVRQVVEKTGIHLALSSGFTNMSFTNSLVLLACLVILLGRAGLPAYSLAALIWLMLVDPLKLAKPRQAFAAVSGDMLLTQLDIGQGTAILIETREYRLLYDTGPQFASHSSAARQIVKPYLDARNIRKLDTVIVSHGDSDHAGGVAFINQQLPVDQWLVGGRALDLAYRSPPQACIAGQQWQRDGLDFRILWPVNGAVSGNENDLSCVLQISARDQTGAAKLLLTGDISKQIEHRLALKDEVAMASEIMTVPHHGSNTSSSIALLASVKPSIALVSSGHHNAYGHPNQKVVERYIDRNIPLYRSDQLGAIQFRLRNNRWTGPYCSRYLPRHFWQHFDNREICVGALKLP